MVETATREKLLRPQFIVGLAFLVMVLLLVAIMANAVMSWLENKQQVPLQKVIVSGEISHITQADIERAVRQSQPYSFFNISVDKAHSDIEELAWVYQASVRKEWPDTLKVYVIEQRAVASWNGDMLMNPYGGTFAPGQASVAGLPVLFGPGGSELAALQGFNAMQGLLRNTGLKITELFLSERYAWNVELNNGVKLRLGRTEFIDRLQRFIDIYPLLLRNEKQVDYVDLRYDTGLAVGWRNAKESE